MGISKVKLNELADFSDFITKVGTSIEKKSIDKNKHIKTLMEENKKDLISMMNESYQDAFNIETKRRRK